MMGVGIPRSCNSAESKQVVLIAGAKSHPVGQHEYLRTVKLLKYLLEHSSNAAGLRADTYFDGWPDDISVLGTADSIVTMADSGDYLKNPGPVSFLTDERMTEMAKAMRRGAGLVTLHSATFAPAVFADDILAWTGGYFDWQRGEGKGGFYGSPVDDHTRLWYSIIRTERADVHLGSPRHPVSSGVPPFSIVDEYYYRLHFSHDSGWRPILTVPAFSSLPVDQVVAWAMERPGGGRGFGFTPGHFYANWRSDPFRKVVLNAIVWSAGLPVPIGGVESKFTNEEEINRAEMVRPLPTLIVGDGSNPEQFKTSLAPAIAAALNSETPRFEVTLSSNPTPLADELSRYRLVVLAGCGALAEQARDHLTGLRDYLARGGGMLVIYSTETHPAGETPIGNSKPPDLRHLCKPIRWGRTSDASSVAGDGWARVMIEMHVADAAHPAMRGLNDRRIEKWETNSPIDFELTPAGDMHVLAIGRSIDTGHHNPMAFTSKFGRARIIQVVAGDVRMINVSGQDAEPLMMPNLSPLTSDLLRRGGLWAAGD